MKKRLSKRPVSSVKPMPAWEKIVPMMHDKGLDGWLDEIVQVIDHPKHIMRFVILKSEHGYYQYVFEMLRQFDEEEWKYIGNRSGALPAMWVPINDGHVSLFSGIEETLEAVKASPEYKLHFLTENGDLSYSGLWKE